jgi:hypothetical protein
VDWHICGPGDPHAEGLVERLFDHVDPRFGGQM